MPNRTFHTLYYHAWYQSEHSENSTDGDLEELMDEMT